MKNFAELYLEMNRASIATTKVLALKHYLEKANEEELKIAVSFFLGHNIKSIVKVDVLKAIVCDLVQIKEWMFEECIKQGPTIDETISLLIPPPEILMIDALSDSLAMISRAKNLNNEDLKAFILNYWKSHDAASRIVFNKIITGKFKFQIGMDVLSDSFSQWTGIHACIMNHRLENADFKKLNFEKKLMLQDTSEELFLLPHENITIPVLDVNLVTLGEADNWYCLERQKGVKVQVVKRKGEVHIWDENKRLISTKFPEIVNALKVWPDGTVVVGVVQCLLNNTLDPLALQKRISRTRIIKKTLDEFAVVFIVEDVWEVEGENVVKNNFSERRLKLESFIQKYLNEHLHLAEIISFSTWDVLKAYRNKSSANKIAGWQLFHSGKEASSKTFYWEKQESKVYAILMYVKTGPVYSSGQGLEYTFGLWQNEALVPFVKITTGMRPEDRKFIDAFLKDNTIEKFGPVKNIKAEIVFEIFYSGIEKNPRKKSGLKVLQPRLGARLIDFDVNQVGQLSVLICSD